MSELCASEFCPVDVSSIRRLLDTYADDKCSDSAKCYSLLKSSQAWVEL